MGSVRLKVNLEKFRNQIQSQKLKGTQILTAVHEGRDNITPARNKFLTWDEFNTTLLKNAFEVHGSLTISPENEYGQHDLDILNLKFGTPSEDAEVAELLKRIIEEKLRTLDSINDRVELWAEVSPEPSLASGGNEIFLVHGRDHATRETIRGFLGRATEREIIVLDETAGKGADILGKLLTQASRAAFAVVLLPGDDKGCLASSDDLKPRARQNVILELGLFIGLLGREKVTCVYQEGVELPSDYLGVSYVALDNNRGWQIDLVRELRTAGIDASIDKLL
ncbi:nucleotide-binding protein [Actinomadura graeca]|uniref:Nucleotide-binding protein n=1 Tax=Actinomadura graeca TaxID=2750812 RepID=A0ABX8QVJ1_9ACTN|nr:nucleotide-binding protein [Actinomadura graeca]QXJ22790.1 nucleotide-binding protein [Actinomadura graeca]